MTFIKKWIQKLFTIGTKDEVKGGLMVAFILYLIPLIIKFIKGISLIEAYYFIFNYQVSLGWVIILAFLGFLTFFTFNRFSTYSKKNALKSCNKLTDPIGNVQFRWNVHFRLNNTPFPTDVTVFCTNHPGSPVHFIDGGCPRLGCKNNNLKIDYRPIINGIESELIEKWEAMNNR